MLKPVSAALALVAGLSAASPAAFAAPSRQAQVTTLRDFRFATGETLPEMKVRYLTLGSPDKPAVLVLHGTGGRAESLIDGWGAALFGPGAPLDANEHYIIAPDAIGHGGSSKPSDGLRMAFPRYDYADMVEAQRQLLDQLGVRRLKLVIGNSMGGMLAWTWAETHPDAMDAVVALASSPAPVSARNWISRRLVIDMIKADPAWKGGDYETQPPSLAMASTYYGLLTSGGTLAQSVALPDWKTTDEAVAALLARPAGGDANDLIYQLLAARTYDPEPGLAVIKARLLAVNAEDDERNPVELNVLPRLMPRVKNGRFHIIPVGEASRGHGTTGDASLWAGVLRDFLKGK